MTHRLPLGVLATLLAVGLLLAGCASSGTARSSQIYRTNLGTTVLPSLINESQEVLINRYGYRYNRQETQDEDVLLETEWRLIQPTADERALGVEEVQTRIIVTSRPRNRLAGTISVRFVGEVQAVLPGSVDLQMLAVTAEREDYFREVSNELEQRITTGVR
ncbi:MAG: hypothetical protein AAGI71_05750 [Bacteroidota bacterium]